MLIKHQSRSILKVPVGGTYIVDAGAAGTHDIHSQEQAAIFAREDVTNFFQVHVD